MDTIREGQITYITMVSDVKNYFLETQNYFMMVYVQVSKFVVLLL